MQSHTIRYDINLVTGQEKNIDAILKGYKREE